MLINNEINVGQMMAYLSATQMIQLVKFIKFQNFIFFIYIYLRRSFTQISILFGQALRGFSSGARVFEVCLNFFKR
jgi:hypothetical protein